MTKKGLMVCLLMSLLAVTGCVTYKDVAPHTSGWRSPSLSARAQTGQIVNLKRATSGPWAIVFFYPKADTPG
jgi:hypothetical protein